MTLCGKLMFSNKPTMAKNTVLATSSATAPSTVFLGLMREKNGCRPKRSPATMAAVSPTQMAPKTAITYPNPRWLGSGRCKKYSDR